MKDDALGRYAGRFGRVGRVLQEWGNRVWGVVNPKTTAGKWATGVLLAGILLAPAVPKWIAGKVQKSAESAVSAGVASLPAAQGASIPAPKIESATYGAGHKVTLKWSPAGEGYAYRVYADCSYDPKYPHFDPIVRNQAIKTPGAVISMDSETNVSPDCAVSVLAVAPDGRESDLSEPVKVRWTVSNTRDEVQPLGGILTASESQPTAEAPPVPKGLKATLLGQEGVHLKWAAAGPGYRYNVYAAPQESPEAFEKETDAPLGKTEMKWWNGSPYKNIVFAVTAVDKEGRESSRSESVEVELR